jgi:alanyl-tRNA synthetase
VNHSATHLLHLALREVLGDHVKQAGSRVSDRSLRFDFSHFEPITPDQLQEIESIVNQQIQANHPVTTQVLPVEEAKRSGAMALFGEKYGAQVRVVQIGPRSKELCGGTHAQRSGDLGVLTILSEGGISAGVRRVEALSGISAVQELNVRRRLLQDLSALLKTTERELPERVQKLLEHQRSLEKEASRLDHIVKAEKSADLSKQALTLSDGTRVIASVIDGATPKQLREVADNLRERLGSGCIALATVNEGKAVLLTAVTKDLVDRYHAGNLMQELAKVVGSRGGGKADLAQAGGGDPEKIDQALKRFQELIA